jgi:hypothetical protein
MGGTDFQEIPTLFFVLVILLGRSSKDRLFGQNGKSQQLMQLHRPILARRLLVVSSGRFSLRFSKGCIAIALLLLASALAWGQLPQTKGHDIDGHAFRMSFTSSQFAVEGFFVFPQICFSVDQTGHYEMRRLAMKVSAESSQGKIFRMVPELLQGALPAAEWARLEKLLEDPDLLKSGSGPSVLRKGAETFVAEVPRENGVTRVVLSDADGENPFPRSADRIINWLQHFKAEGAEPLDVSADDICPSATFQPVHPATALLEPIASTNSCSKR